MIDLVIEYYNGRRTTSDYYASYRLSRFPGAADITTGRIRRNRFISGAYQRDNRYVYDMSDRIVKSCTFTDTETKESITVPAVVAVAALTIWRIR